jgi:hypothetical protein
VRHAAIGKPGAMENHGIHKCVIAKPVTATEMHPDRCGKQQLELHLAFI